VAGWLQAAVVIALVGALHVPLGDYMARAFTARRHWRVEGVIYRLGGMDPGADQPWPRYIRSLLATSVAGIVVLYLLLRLQGHLPFSLGHPGMSPALAFDTAVSFTTNTSWQNYAGESTLGYCCRSPSGSRCCWPGSAWWRTWPAGMWSPHSPEAGRRSRAGWSRPGTWSS
jgi:potassium-transporting ATPase potassium-binding subunit